MSQDQVDTRVARSIQACRSAGIRVTPQRTEILRCLSGCETHPDAEAIYMRVRKTLPAVSLDTVYRTLRLFEEKKVIARMGAGRDRARFDANRTPHHHFVCTKCGRIQDVAGSSLSGFAPSGLVKELGQVDEVYVELRGICKECAR